MSCWNKFENYVIGFKEEYTYREKYYKIQDKSFDIKKIIEELQEGVGFIQNSLLLSSHIQI